MSSNSNVVVETSKSGQASERSLILFEIVEVLGRRSFVPFIALPAILGLTPLGTTVLFAIIAGLIYVWIGFQLLTGHKFLNLPSKIAFNRVNNRLAQYFSLSLLTAKEWLDEVPNPRMAWLTSSAFAKIPFLMLIVVGLALPALVLAGQSIFLICIAALIYCVALLTHDGRYILASACVLSFASIGPLFQLTS